MRSYERVCQLSHNPGAQITYFRIFFIVSIRTKEYFLSRSNKMRMRTKKWKQSHNKYAMQNKITEYVVHCMYISFDQRDNKKRETDQTNMRKQKYPLKQQASMVHKWSWNVPACADRTRI